jgi:hypothetical protein
MLSFVNIKMNKNIWFFILVLSVSIMPLAWSFYRLPLITIIIATLGFFLLFKFPKSWFLILPVLFLLNLNLNKLFVFDIKSLDYSFDWEKIVITNPNNIEMVDHYWHEDLFLPYRIRNIFYSPWLLGFSWINLIFKLISPVFLIRVIGYSGFFLLFLGIIQFIREKNKKWFFVLWASTIIMSSGLGILVDSKKAMVLTIPAIIYFIYLAIKKNKIKKVWICWFILFLIDLILK